VDVARPSQLLDVVAGRTAADPSAWIEAQPEAWRSGVAWGVLDLSGPYRKTFTDTLPDAEQVADPFHVVKVRHEAPCLRGRVRDPPLRAVAAAW
jgi:transposase